MSYATKNVTIKVERALTEWEMDDLRQAAAAIVAGETFIFVGDDEVSDDMRRFLIDHPNILTNIEQVADALDD